MSLHQEIKEKATQAMKSKETERLEVLRGILASFTNELVAQKRKPQEELGGQEALSVIKKMAKQRKDSIEQYRKGGREDLAKAEESELEILNTFLPAEASPEEIKKVALIKKEELGITDKSKMGLLMGAVMKELKNQADGKVVKEVVESIL